MRRVSRQVAGSGGDELALLRSARRPTSLPLLRGGGALFFGPVDALFEPVGHELVLATAQRIEWEPVRITACEKGLRLIVKVIHEVVDRVFHGVRMCVETTFVAVDVQPRQKPDGQARVITFDLAEGPPVFLAELTQHAFHVLPTFGIGQCGGHRCLRLVVGYEVRGFLHHFIL